MGRDDQVPNCPPSPLALLESHCGALTHRLPLHAGPCVCLGADEIGGPPCKTEASPYVKRTRLELPCVCQSSDYTVVRVKSGVLDRMTLLMVRKAQGERGRRATRGVWTPFGRSCHRNSGIWAPKFARCITTLRSGSAFPCETLSHDPASCSDIFETERASTTKSDLLSGTVFQFSTHCFCTSVKGQVRKANLQFYTVCNKSVGNTGRKSHHSNRWDDLFLALHSPTFSLLIIRPRLANRENKTR